MFQKQARPDNFIFNYFSTVWKWTSYSYIIRSSVSQVFFNIDILKNFVIFTGKHLCWNLFLIKLQTWRPAAILKRDSNISIFALKIAKFLRTAFFIEHFFYTWLLLHNRPLSDNTLKKRCFVSDFLRWQFFQCISHIFRMNETSRKNSG